MNYDEIYNFYLSHVPLNSESLLNNITSNVDKLREEIIRKHRTITLAYVLTNNQVQNLNYEEELPPPSERPLFAFKPHIVHPPHVSPQLIQQCSHLFLFLHQNPADLFDGLISIKGTPLYYFVINSSLPALYGYFSSQEHFQFAFPFYAHALQYEDHKACSEILFPYFNTPSVYRMIEHVMAPFCDRLLTDPRIKINEKNSSSLLEIYALDFTRLFIESLPLFIQTALLLLMKQSWGVIDTKEFIINVLIKTFSVQWLKASELLDYVNIMEEILSNIANDSSKYSAILNKLGETRVLLEIPEMFNSFGHQYILFLASRQDFNALIKVVSIKKKVPSSITISKKPTIPDHALFWLKIFPKRKIPHISQSRPLFFSQNLKVDFDENSDLERVWRCIQSDAIDSGEEPYQYICSHKNFRNISKELKNYTLIHSLLNLKQESETFEQVMLVLLHYRELKKWLVLAESHLQLVSAPIASLATTLAHNRGYKYLNYAFNKSIQLFENRATQQNQYLLLVQHYLPHYLEITKAEKKLAIIDKWWSNVIIERNNNLENLTAFQKNKSVNTLFWDCVVKLASVSKNNIMYSFNVIIQVVDTIVNLLKVVDFTQIESDKDQEKPKRSASLPNNENGTLKSVQDSSSLTIHFTKTSKENNKNSLSNGTKQKSMSTSPSIGLNMNKLCVSVIGNVIGKIAILGKATDLLHLYIVIGSLCIDNQVFKDICTESEQSNWCALEAAMFGFMKDNLEISQLVSDIQDDLRSIEKEGIDTQK